VTGGAPGNNTYTATSADVGAYLFYCVQPLAQTGLATGVEVCSAPDAVVASNQPPVASELKLSGIARVDESLNGTYAYSDPDGDYERSGETGSVYYIIRSSDASVATTADNTPVIGPWYTDGAPGDNTYVVVPPDVGHYLFYCVEPRASTGATPGALACGAPFGPAVPAVPVPPPAAVQPVPALDALGKALLVTALGLLAAWWVPRRGSPPRRKG